MTIANVEHSDKTLNLVIFEQPYQILAEHQETSEYHIIAVQQFMRKVLKNVLKSSHDYCVRNDSTVANINFAQW